MGTDSAGVCVCVWVCGGGTDSAGVSVCGVVVDTDSAGVSIGVEGGY